MIGKLAAIAVLAPLVLPTQPVEASGLVAELCGGGSIVLPIDLPADEPAPCNEKACHAAQCRKKFDPAQGRTADPLA
ncbi:hypothetical protein [Erythrobacter sp. HKB08]|uniref:hypothetical protein n=1 Tax=Erythrobacter sp. HKB08 TaxID=2502843 RepID=UPI001008E46A|nr:hypothetical protein [Erythrobacter sp. HKB08]